LIAVIVTHHPQLRSSGKVDRRWATVISPLVEEKIRLRNYGAPIVSPGACPTSILQLLR